MKNTIIKMQGKFIKGFVNVKKILANKSGEGFVDSAVKILISVVIGALLLGGLYMLFKDTVLFSSRYKHDRKCYA